MSDVANGNKGGEVTEPTHADKAAAVAWAESLFDKLTDPAAAGHVAGVVAERERCAKLLEDECEHWTDPETIELLKIMASELRKGPQP